MTERQLVIDTIRHKECPRVPYSASFSEVEKDRLAEFYGDSNFENKWSYCIAEAEYASFEEVEPEHFRDIFGVVWNRSGADKEIGVVEHALITDITGYHYRFPEPDEKLFRSQIEKLLQENPGKFNLVGIGFALYERVWSLMTIEETLVAMAAYPKELEELFEKICDFNMQLLDIALTYNIDGFMFGDDWGQQKGMIMGATHWRKFIKPHLARMYSRVKSAGKYVVQHSCGDIQEVFPDLIDIGLDIYQTFQPEIYCIEKIKAEFGADLSFWGGISTQKLLPMADPTTVRSETARIMRVMSKNGGYIAAPTHQVPGDVPPENIDAMMDVFVNQDKYL